MFTLWSLPSSSSRALHSLISVRSPPDSLFPRPRKPSLDFSNLQGSLQPPRPHIGRLATPWRQQLPATPSLANFGPSPRPQPPSGRGTPSQLCHDSRPPPLAALTTMRENTLMWGSTCLMSVSPSQQAQLKKGGGWGEDLVFRRYCWFSRYKEPGLITE